jgi:hypothetical protein
LGCFGIQVDRLPSPILFIACDAAADLHQISMGDVDFCPEQGRSQRLRILGIIVDLRRICRFGSGLTWNLVFLLIAGNCEPVLFQIASSDSQFLSRNQDWVENDIKGISHSPIGYISCPESREVFTSPPDPLDTTMTTKKPIDQILAAEDALGHNP